MTFCRDISSHKNPDPGYKYPRNIPKIKNPEKINPDLRGYGIFSGLLNPDPDTRDFEISRIFHSGFFRGFQIPIPISVILEFSGFFTRDFCEVFISRSRSSVFGFFGIFHSGFFRGFHIPIPIPGISKFSGFFTRDFFRIFKFRSRISGIGIRDLKKIPSRSQLWALVVIKYGFKYYIHTYLLVSTISWLVFTFEIQQCPVLVSLVILTRILTVCSHSQSTLPILNSCVKNSGPNFKTWLENFRQNFSFPEWQLFLRY